MNNKCHQTKDIVGILLCVSLTLLCTIIVDTRSLGIETEYKTSGIIEKNDRVKRDANGIEKDVDDPRDATAHRPSDLKREIPPCRPGDAECATKSRQRRYAPLVDDDYYSVEDSDFDDSDIDDDDDDVVAIDDIDDIDRRRRKRFSLHDDDRDGNDLSDDVRIGYQTGKRSLEFNRTDALQKSTEKENVTNKFIETMAITRGKRAAKKPNDTHTAAKETDDEEFHPISEHKHLKALLSAQDLYDDDDLDIDDYDDTVSESTDSDDTDSEDTDSEDIDSEDIDSEDTDSDDTDSIIIKRSVTEDMSYPLNHENRVTYFNTTFNDMPRSTPSYREFIRKTSLPTHERDVRRKRYTDDDDEDDDEEDDDDSVNDNDDNDDDNADDDYSEAIYNYNESDDSDTAILRKKRFDDDYGIDYWDSDMPTGENANENDEVADYFDLDRFIRRTRSKHSDISANDFDLLMEDPADDDYNQYINELLVDAKNVDPFVEVRVGLPQLEVQRVETPLPDDNKRSHSVTNSTPKYVGKDEKAGN